MGTVIGKIARTTSIVENGIKIERGYDKAGKVIKESVFKDYNNDGNFEKNELFSIKYLNNNFGNDYVQYYDNDKDGYCDKIVTETPVLGKKIKDEKNILNQDEKEPYGKSWRLMDSIYGFEPEGVYPRLIQM